MVAVVGSTGSANRDGEHSHVTGELKRTVTRVNRETARAIFFPAGGCAVVACSSLGGLMGDVMYTRVSRQQTAVAYVLKTLAPQFAMATAAAGTTQ